MEEIITKLIDDTLGCFNIPYCIIVNIATYLIIKGITDIKCNIYVSFWHKRLVLLIVSVIVSYIYYITGTDIKTLVNSMVLAPVAWSWLLKPIFNKLNIDYKPKDNNKDCNKDYYDED